MCYTVRERADGLSKEELVEELEKFDDDDVVVGMNKQGVWDNIQKLGFSGLWFFGIKEIQEIPKQERN